MRALPGKASRQPPGPEPVSRAAAAADQRRRILEATADLVAEQGYAETTIEQIVRRAKVGYATFYKHYADKQEAFLALLDAAVERTVYVVEEAYDREDGPWPDKVGAGLGALLAAGRGAPQRRPRLPGRGADRGARGGGPPRGGAEALRAAAATRPRAQPAQRQAARQRSRTPWSAASSG